MDIEKLIRNNTLKIKVKPGSKESKIVKWDSAKEELILQIKAVPEKGKANEELIRFFKKEFNKKISIIKGHKSREKIIIF